MSDTPVEPSSVSVGVEPSVALDAVQQIALAAMTGGATIRQAAKRRMQIERQRKGSRTVFTQAGRAREG